MKKTLLLIALTFAVSASAQTPREAFEGRIDSILATSPACVGFALRTPSGELITRNDVPMPMMSVFKFPLAIAVLDGLNHTSTNPSRTIHVGREWLSPDTYSPLRDSLPADGGTVSVRDLLRFSIALSDNIACNILIDAIGGAQVLDAYIRSLGIEGIHVETDEAGMRGSTEAQRLNTGYPSAICGLFDRFLKGGVLPQEYDTLLKNLLEATATGANKLKAGLPAGTVIGHKTGFSDRTPEGLRIADNDAGYVILPDGRIYIIVVMVTESPADNEENAAIAAALSKAAYEYCLGE